MCLAIPGRIVEMSATDAHRALVDVIGVRRTVDVSLVEPDGIAPGDWVLIHVGFAMSKILEADAYEQLQTLRALGETEAALEEAQGYSEDNADPRPLEPSSP